MPSHWLELSIIAGPEVQDPVANFLVERGSTGIVHTDHRMRAFFPSTEDDTTLKRAIRGYLRQLRDIFPGSPVGPTRWRVIADRNWHDAWRKHFKPQRIGKRFLVTPPWIRAAEVDRHVILIEPAMAFGTGTHETTRCCLEFIDELGIFPRKVPSTALDVGTGSGILAIALARIGVHGVLAVDNDPIALEAAESNLKINEVEAAVTLSGMEVSRLRRRFPFVVANIILDTLVQISESLTRCVDERGTLILSGLLRTQVASVLGHFEGFTLELRKDRKEWSTLLLRKNS